MVSCSVLCILLCYGTFCAVCCVMRSVVGHVGIVLCCAVLCCAVLCCPVLCCAVLCCAVLCCAVLCCAVLCYAVLRCVVLCCVVFCCVGIVLCCVVLCCAVLHCIGDRDAREGLDAVATQAAAAGAPEFPWSWTDRVGIGTTSGDGVWPAATLSGFVRVQGPA